MKLYLSVMSTILNCSILRGCKQKLLIIQVACLRYTQTIMLYLLYILCMLIIQIFSENNDLTIKIHGVCLIFRVTISDSILVGSMCIFLITLMV